MKLSRKKKGIIINAVWGLCALLFLALFWLIAYFAIGNDYILPSPWLTVVKSFEAFATADFWWAFASACLRALIAFSISAILAFVFALISYLYPSFGRVFTAICAVLRSLPTMAALLILLFLFRRVEVPVAVGVLTLTPVLFTGYFNAFSGVDKGLIEMSKTFGVPLKKRLVSLYIPSMKGALILESASSLSFSLKIIVSAEILANVAGSLGKQMFDAANYGQTPTLYALTLIVCLLGLLIEWSAGLIAKEGV